MHALKGTPKQWAELFMRNTIQLNRGLIASRDGTPAAAWESYQLRRSLIPLGHWFANIKANWCTFFLTLSISAVEHFLSLFVFTLAQNNRSCQSFLITRKKNDRWKTSEDDECGSTFPWKLWYMNFTDLVFLKMIEMQFSSVLIRLFF